MTCSALNRSETAFFPSRAGLALPLEPERQSSAPSLSASRRLEKEIPIVLAPAVLDVYEVGGAMRIGILADGNPISLVDPFGLWSWGETLSVAGHFALGVAVGAVITAAVIVAAPVVASAGAAALVAAGISAATATTVSTATVTVGLYAAGSYGAYRTVANTAQSVGTATVTGDWNPVAYNVGTIVGGTAVGVSGGGRALAENLMGGPSAAPNTWNPRAMLDYEIANAYKRSLGPPGLDYWATAPTPFSGGFTAGGIATGIGTSLPIGNAAK